MVERLPLPGALTGALLTFADDFEGGEEPPPRIEVWANVLQYLADGGLPLGALRERSCLSRRALKVAVGRLAARGFVTTDAGGGKVVELGPAGRVALDAWRPRFAAVEEDWRRRAGPAAVDALRHALEAVVGRLELELPQYPVQYGTSDHRVTGGNGVDWKAFPRRGAPHGLPLSALLSQALMAFTIDYEHRNGPLAWSANLLRLLGNGGRPRRELPQDVLPMVGGLAHHGFVRVGDDRDRTVTPTSAGRRLRDAYLPTLASVEEEWLARYGEGTVTALRAALEAVMAQLGAARDLPHHPPTNWLWTR